MATLYKPIYVPSDLLEAFGEHTGHFWSDPEMEPLIFDLIRAAMNPAPAAQQQPAAQSEAGYQWKQVFLPEGTRLRASFGGQPCFAVVAGAEIKFGEHTVSPSCFANLYGSGNRNAWKAVWLRFPGSDEWLLADVCRRARKAVITRMLGDGVPETAQASRAVRPGGPGEGKQRSSSPQRDNRAHARPGAAVGPIAAIGAARQHPPEDAHQRNPGAKHGAGRGARRKRRKAKRAAAQQ